MILHSCQINAVLPYVRELHNMISPHGKIWLYARNVILSKKNAAWDIYWRVWKRNIRGHAENCLLIICSSRGCIVFSPIFLSNFLGGCPNHEKINKKNAHLDDIQRCGWVGMGWPCSEKKYRSWYEIMCIDTMHLQYTFLMQAQKHLQTCICIVVILWLYCRGVVIFHMNV